MSVGGVVVVCAGYVVFVCGVKPSRLNCLTPPQTNPSNQPPNHHQVAALLRCKSLSVLREEQLDALVEAAEPVRFVEAPAWFGLERGGSCRFPASCAHSVKRILSCTHFLSQPLNPITSPNPHQLPLNQPPNQTTPHHTIKRYQPGELVAPAGPAPCAAFFLVRTGEVLLYPPTTPTANLPALFANPANAAQAAAAAGRLTAGDLHNEVVLTSPAAPLANALVAGPRGAVVIVFELASLNRALAGPGGGFESFEGLQGLRVKACVHLSFEPPLLGPRYHPPSRSYKPSTPQNKPPIRWPHAPRRRPPPLRPLPNPHLRPHVSRRLPPGYCRRSRRRAVPPAACPRHRPFVSRHRL